MKPRLLIFDLLRIIAITAIVFYHWVNISSSIDLGFVGASGVLLFVVISGALIEYTTPTIQTLKELGAFYKHRFLKIYPAYVISVLIVIVLTQIYLSSNTFTSAWGELLGLSGFYDFSRIYPILNPSNWFVTVILVLYLLYPLLSYLVKKQTILTLIGTYALTQIASIHLTFGGNLFLYIFLFSLGIAITKWKLYPTVTHTSEGLSFTSELSFYVFLIHYPMILYFRGIPARLLDGLNVPFLNGISIVAILIIILGVSIALMRVDKRIQPVVNK